MKTRNLSLFILLVAALSVVSCDNSQKQKASKEKIEKEAEIVGKASKDLLTTELKLEVKNFLKDLPKHDLQEQIASGKKNIVFNSTSFMLPISKVNDMNSNVQKARAFGIYGTDAGVLRELKKPTIDHEKVMVKLAVDLDIPFDTENRGVSNFEECFDAMVDNDKIDVLLEILGSICVEHAMLYAAPGTMINDNVTIEGLSKNLNERFTMILEITKDLSSYYPHLQFMGKTLESLKDLLIPISKARKSRAQIEAMRESLLK